MSKGLYAAIGAAYLYIALRYFNDGRPGMAIALIGYAIGNVGLIIDFGRK